MKALYKEKAEAVRMRREGASYTQIKQKLKVSKSSLSLWLRDYPLPEERIKELRDNNSVRIEKYRETRRKVKEFRLNTVRNFVQKDIGSLTDRELFIAGLFLYWGEGTKTAEALTCLSNTDPIMLRFFVKWMQLLGIPKEKLRVKIHLYADMEVEAELEYWSQILQIPRSNFRKPYIKNSKQSGLSYPQKFKHGTANVLFGNRDISEKVLISLEYIRSLFADSASL